jgi:hypothetical protein
MSLQRVDRLKEPPEPELVATYVQLYVEGVVVAFALAVACMWVSIIATAGGI